MAKKSSEPRPRFIEHSIFNPASCPETVFVQADKSGQLWRINPIAGTMRPFVIEPPAPSVVGNTAPDAK